MEEGDNMAKQVELSEEEKQQFEKFRTILLDECYKNSGKLTFWTIMLNAFKIAKRAIKEGVF